MPDYVLSSGSHTRREDGMCALEWVSYLAGEPHSDSPVCVSPILTRYCIRLNDRLGDEDRQKLRPYLARTIGTRDDGMDEQRVQMCREFLVRYALPSHLDRAGRTEAAEYLRSLPAPLTERETLRALYFARDEAREVCTEARVRLTERIRAELAKRGYSVTVAATATVADGSSRWFAIRDAVYSAVYAKSGERAREINAEMVPAALDLLNRMLPTELIQVPVVAEWREVCGVQS
ncbi:MAG: hypothetical protein NVS3B21_31630 [Acidimicrobiales bacterium]